MVMMNTFLVSENTTVTAKGDGEVVDVSGASSRTFLLTLNVSETVEQESLDVSVFASADGTTWDAKPITSFPQKFYRGETPILLELETRPDVRFVRAHWEVNRWGRGPEQPMFVFQVGMKEVPTDVLAEARRSR
jgi:hypothetical protein